MELATSVTLFHTIPKLIELTVDFDKMQLKAVNEVVEDMCLPEKFRFQLAKKAIHRNMDVLQADKRRNSKRMVDAKITTYYEQNRRSNFHPFVQEKRIEPVFPTNKIQFYSSEDVLIHVGQNSSFSTFEFNQEGCPKVVMMKYEHSFGCPKVENSFGCPKVEHSYGNEYFFVQKNKLATLDFTTENCSSNFFEIENILTEDFEITFKSKIVKCCQIKLSFCSVDDYSETLESKKKEPGLYFIIRNQKIINV